MPQSNKTGKKSNHVYPKKRFPNCGMWVELAEYKYLKSLAQELKQVEETRQRPPEGSSSAS
jgi:hypothetical protein